VTGVLAGSGVQRVPSALRRMSARASAAMSAQRVRTSFQLS
jgi:hypothetical protein